MDNMEIYKKCIEFKKRAGRWPGSKVKVNNVYVSKKELTEKLKNSEIEKELYDNMVEELDLYNKWKASPEHKILLQYVGVPMDKIPKEYQEMINTLRSMGLGFSGGKIDIVERFEAFYNEHGRTPKWLPMQRDELSEDKLIERRLYERWITSNESKLIKKYMNIPLEEIPQEHKETVKRLRAIGIGVGERKLTAMEEYMAFVRAHAREPIHYINPVGDEQIKEHAIKQRWKVCKAHSLFNKYKGVLLEEIPQEHRPIIAELRQMWLEVDGEHVMEEYFNFIDVHKREPIDYNQGRCTFGKVLSEDKVKEADLASKWNRCFEKQVMDRFSKSNKIPTAYKKIIEVLRSHDLAYPESYNTRMYMQITRNTGLIPRQVIIKNGKRVPHKNYNESEQYETYVRAKFDASDDKKIYEEYKLGILAKRKMCTYKNMIQELDKIYQLNEESRAKLSAIRKMEYTQKVKRENISKSAKSKLKRELVKQEKKQEKIMQKVSPEIQKKADNKQREIEFAELYIKYIKEHKKIPEGISCKFLETVDVYAGVPIEQVPEEYRAVISEFRSEGFGLTADEYFKFRSNRSSKDILFRIKTKRDMCAEKKAKALELEEEIIKELRKRAIERD